MNASLRELQRRFAASLAGADGDARLGVYRNSVATNYRNAMGATYAVVRELTGTPFFNAAVDAFAMAHASAGGDLNVYGSEFASFLASYAHARDLAYLPDVARLEWALDEAMRAPDRTSTAGEVLEALARLPADTMTRQRLVLDASCRLVSSPFPVMRIWQVHQSGDDRRVDLDAGTDRLLVRREADVPTIARLAPADFALLGACADGNDLGSAFEAAIAADNGFDLAHALRTFIGDGTIAGLE